MSDSYTILDKQPEVLSCLDEAGERVTPERWAINNEIFKDKNKKIEQLKKENEALKAAVCIHAREHGDRLGDGISSDDKAVAAFTEYYNPDNWDI